MWGTDSSTDGRDHFRMHLTIECHGRPLGQVKVVVHLNKFRTELLRADGNPATAIAASLERLTKQFTVSASAMRAMYPTSSLPHEKGPSVFSKEQNVLQTSGSSGRSYPNSGGIAIALEREWSSYSANLCSRHTNICRTIPTMCGSRKPNIPFTFLTLALSICVDTAEMFLNCFAPLPVAPATVVP